MKTILMMTLLAVSVLSTNAAFAATHCGEVCCSAAEDGCTITENGAQYTIFDGGRTRVSSQQLDQLSKLTFGSGRACVSGIVIERNDGNYYKSVANVDDPGAE